MGDRRGGRSIPVVAYHLKHTGAYKCWYTGHNIPDPSAGSIPVPVHRSIPVIVHRSIPVLVHRSIPVPV